MGLYLCTRLCAFVWMNECVWLCIVCVRVCVNGGPWPGHTLLMLPPRGMSGEMDACMCVGVCLCTFVCVHRGSRCVVKRRLVKDGQRWYDQSSVDQDVLLPPRCSFSLWISLLTRSLFFSLCLFHSLSPSLCLFLFCLWILPLFYFSGIKAHQKHKRRKLIDHCDGMKDTPFLLPQSALSL